MARRKISGEAAFSQLDKYT